MSERRIIQEEEEWKQKSQQAPTEVNDLPNNEQKPPEKIETPEPVEVKKEEKTVMASCNCGQIFSSTFSGKSSPEQDEVKVKTYDSSGNVSETYSVSGSGSQQGDYAASGDQNKDYAKQ